MGLPDATMTDDVAKPEEVTVATATTGAATEEVKIGEKRPLESSNQVNEVKEETPKEATKKAKVETPNEVKVETPNEMKVETPNEMKVETPNEMKVETPNEMKVETPNEMKVETPNEAAKQLEEKKAKVNETAESTEETEEARKNRLHVIRKQMEYYFSDDNLKFDKFFHKIISQNENGYISIEPFMNCKKLVALSCTEKDILEAVKESPEIEVGPEEKALRRKDNKPLPALQERRGKNKEKKTIQS